MTIETDVTEIKDMMKKAKSEPKEENRLVLFLFLGMLFGLLVGVIVVV